MRNDIFQMCCYVSVIKQRLLLKKHVNFTDNLANIENIRFNFLPRRNFFLGYTRVANNFKEWEQCLKKEKLVDIKLFTPIYENSKELLFAANAAVGFITCFYKNGLVTKFTPYWFFNKYNKKWSIEYTEIEWKNPDLNFFKFKDNTKDFIKILNTCINFSTKAHLNDFVITFQNCLDILNGKGFSEERRRLTMPILSKEKLKLFEAASMADVFGGMGSWNDISFNSSLKEEYQILSDELFKQYKLAILYTINEF